MKLFVGSKQKDFVFDIDNVSLSLISTHIRPNLKVGNFGYAWNGRELWQSHTDVGFKNVTTGEVVGCYARPPNGLHFDHPHQLLTIKGRVYATDPNKNVVHILDLTAHKVRTVKFPDGMDWINSVNYIDGKIHLIAHNHGWSQVIIADMDLNIERTVDNVGYCAHNIWKMGKKLWTNDSGTGFIRAIDGSQCVNVGSFLRGVALNDKYLLLGANIVRESTSIKDIKARRPPRGTENSFIGDSRHGIVILDAHTLDFLKFIEVSILLPALELRLIGERDLAVYVDEGNEIFYF